MNAEIETVLPVVIVTEFRFRSAPLAPTEPSTTRVPVDLVSENHAAVPPAALESLVIVFAAIADAAAAAKALVDGNARAATMVFAAVVAALVSAGWTPA